MTPESTTLVGALVMQRSIRVLDLAVTRVGSFIICSSPKMSNISTNFALFGDVAD